MPDGWAWCRLSNACSILMGQSPEGTSVSNNTNGMEFHQGKIFFTNKYLAESGSYTAEITRIAPESSLLLCVRAPVGVVNITKREICIGRGLCAIKPNYIIDENFWFYWIQCLKADFEQKATGTTFKAISVDIIKQQLIPLPPLLEQQLIINTIERIFSHIENLEKEKNDLQNIIKQTKSKILDLAIHGKLVSQDPNDEPAEELLKRIATSDNRPYEKVDEEPFEIPDSWEWVKLTSICNKLVDGDHNPPKGIE
ncbi:MAG: restriction endonuclease subunit S, partial [Treponema sp.]|nr:restriction endonuclease subunit S [Treponema sp.]